MELKRFLTKVFRRDLCIPRESYFWSAAVFSPGCFPASVGQSPARPLGTFVVDPSTFIESFMVHIETLRAHAWAHFLNNNGRLWTLPSVVVGVWASVEETRDARGHEAARLKPSPLIGYRDLACQHCSRRDLNRYPRALRVRRAHETPGLSPVVALAH